MSWCANYMTLRNARCNDKDLKKKNVNTHSSYRFWTDQKKTGTSTLRSSANHCTAPRCTR